MKYGLTYFPTDLSMGPDAFARAAEARGFESVWFAEHSHMPVSPMTPGPPEPGAAGLPREYYAVGDPFVALAMAAAATQRLKLATGICLVPQRDVFQTAKQVATLDLFSNGRFLFGVGAGWNVPEIEHHGTPAAQRFAVMRERIEAMKRLWADEKAEYHGEHVDFGPSYAWPKPRQQPHPPIHVGGAGKRAIRRAVRYGDGWVPLMGTGDDDPVTLMPHLREALSEAGRDASGFEATIYFCPPDAAVVARCLEGGLTRVLFPVPSADESTVKTTLDVYAK
ncbi:MAG: LLM class F420-dependent oxidoreductase, partial [Myxococcota bacterium]